MNQVKRITAAFLALLTMGALAPLAGCGDAPKSECEIKGHEYSETDLLCVRCEKKAPIPSVPSNQKFPLVEPCTHGLQNCPVCEYVGTGENEWDRLELKEGCYTVEIGSDGELWLSFSVSQAGQYVLHSVGGDEDVAATRHAANAHYVNEKGIAAFEENGEFYSYVNCGNAYFNDEWRATYCLKAPTGTMVQIRFIRIDEPAWEPNIIRTSVYAKELTEKAQDGGEDKELTDVPYDSAYFFDESVGYYRMGTKNAPGEIIYAAIDRAAPRLFGSETDGDPVKFTNLLKNSGTALNISNGLTANGDYNVLCYTPFIMNWVDENASWGSRPGETASEPEGDPNKVCYQNYCNADGVYPVNRELFTFLSLYVKANPPTDSEGANENTTWLSACYYYGQRKDGTEDNPKVLTVGDNSVTLTDPASYYVIQGTGSYTVSCTVDGVKFIADGKITDLTQTTVEGGKVFRLRDDDYEKVTVTITITQNA